MIWANAPSSNKEFLLAFKSVHVVVSGGLSSQRQRSVETITSTGDAAVKTEEKFCSSGRRGQGAKYLLHLDQPPCVPGTASALLPEVLAFGNDLGASPLATPASGAFQRRGH